MTLPEGLAPPAILHIHAHTTTQLAAQTHTHTIYLLDRQTDRQTHPLFPASACRAPLQLSRLWQSCFSMQHVWVSRGEGGDLEVGQGFQETELLSCLGSPLLNNYLSLRARTHTLKTPTVAKSYLRRVHMLRGSVPS